MGDLDNLLQNKNTRIKLFEKNFPLFFAFHFGRSFPDFHIQWMKSLQSDKNVFIEGFRASRKTTIVRGWIVRLIAYKKEPSIIRQSYEDGLSAESVREIAKMLCKQSIVDDYGYLFPLSTKKEDLSKRSLSNFETTNGVKIASKSLGQTLRGANTFDMNEGISTRPTILVLDDIDVIKSVMNVEIINNNEKKILGETISSLDPLRRKIVFLGNTIFEDGIVPRFRDKFKESDKRDIYRQPLIDNGVNVRPEVFVDSVLDNLKSDGKTSWNQNYLLVPDVMGNGVFIREYFDYFLLSHFEMVDSPLKKQDLKCGIFIDPAFSTSDISDDAVIICAGEHKASKHKYLIDGYSDTSAPSRTINAVIVMYNNMTAQGFKIDFISCEDVKINRNQTKFIDDLRTELQKYNIHVPLYLYHPKLRKEQRIKDNLEAPMSQKGWKFNRNITQPNFLAKLEKQLLEFPFGDHDDHPDCISQAQEVFSNKKYEGDAREMSFTVDYSSLL